MEKEGLMCIMKASPSCSSSALSSGHSAFRIQGRLSLVQVKVLVIIACMMSVVVPVIGANNSEIVFRPLKIPYRTLANDTLFQGEASVHLQVLRDALSETGMVSITDIFPTSEGDQDTLFSSSSKSETLGWLHKCALESKLAQMKTYHDGAVVRYTMAALSIPAQHVQMPIVPEEGDLSFSCASFASASNNFRSMVSDVTSLLIKRLLTLASLVYSQNEKSGPEVSFSEFLADVVQNGEHLEHFHSYQKKLIITKEEEEEYEQEDDDDQDGYYDSDESTIPWHIDQGLFLVFTPGRKVQVESSSNVGTLTENGATSKTMLHSTVLKDGLYIQLLDGTQARVDFDDDDDLVLMLGDGMNQFINPILDDKDSGKINGRPLFRATPHALKMEPTKLRVIDEARVWYGRMVLPSGAAISPTMVNNTSTNSNMTFGEIRSALINATVNHDYDNDGKDGPALSLGCSSGMFARDLAVPACKAGTMYCWHSCMKLSTYKVNATYCKKKKLVLGCGDKNGKKWDGSHGSWYPRCLKK